MITFWQFLFSQTPVLLVATREAWAALIAPA